MDVPIEELTALVKKSYQPDSPTHDVSHLARVAALGKRLSSDENADELVVVTAAWLHDFHRDRKVAKTEFFSAPEAFDDRVREFIAMAGIPDEVHAAVLDAIHYTDRFSFSNRAPESASPEARCLRDADNLDAIGAIGVARAFSFGGAHGIPIWDPEAPSASSVFDQKVRPSSTIHHFQEKLMRLGGEFETRTAQRMAGPRIAYLMGFADTLMAEWDEDLR